MTKKKNEITLVLKESVNKPQMKRQQTPAKKPVVAGHEYKELHLFQQQQEKFN